MTDDLNIPDFLNRTETEEQADARRKKYAPKDGSAGLKVKKPPEPVDPKIAKAIARDLKEPKSSGGLQILASMLPAVGDAKPDWQKTQDSLRKAEKEQHAKPAKKAGKLVERAMKARDALAAAAAAKKTNGSPAAKPAKAPAKTSGSKKQSTALDLEYVGSSFMQRVSC